MKQVPELKTLILRGDSRINKSPFTDAGLINSLKQVPKLKTLIFYCYEIKKKCIKK